MPLENPGGQRELSRVVQVDADDTSKFRAVSSLQFLFICHLCVRVEGIEWQAEIFLDPTKEVISIYGVSSNFSRYLMFGVSSLFVYTEDMPPHNNFSAR